MSHIDKKKTSNQLFLLISSIGVMAFLLTATQYPNWYDSFFPKPKSEAAAINGPLRKNTANPRYFTNNSGKSIYLTGTHTWTILQESRTVNAAFSNVSNDVYFKALTDNKHNFIRLWNADNFIVDWGTSSAPFEECMVPHPFALTSPITATDNSDYCNKLYANFSQSNPPIKFDLSKLDSTFVSKLRSVIETARSKNIYVSIMFFDGYNSARIATHWAWDGNSYNPRNHINMTSAEASGLSASTLFNLSNAKVTELQKNYIRMVIDQVNEYDNVLFETSNQALNSTPEWHYAMIKYIQDYEKTKPKQHPVGNITRAHGASNGELFTSSNPSDWVSPHNTSPFADVLNNPPIYSDGRPIILDTDHVGEKDGAGRTWVWKTFIRGYNPIFMESFRADASKQNAILETRRAAGHTVTYSEKIDLNNMKPDTTSCSTQYCLVNTGKEYLVYQPSSGDISVNLPIGQYNGEWFNPATTNINQDSTNTIAITTFSVTTSGLRSFSRPSSITSDAVLYLKSTTSASPTSIPTATPTVKPTVTPTSGPTPTPGNTVGITQLVSVFDPASSANWSVQTNLQNGVQAYGDRTYTINNIPSDLLGINYIRTANDSKFYTSSPIATIKTTQAATVYIGLDARITQIPSWLSSWEKTTQTVTIDSTGTMNLYRKSLVANTNLDLGNNNESSNVSMYTIFVKGTSTVTPTPTTAAFDADINNDGAVNVFDLGLLAAHYGQIVNSTSDATTKACDINADGTINIFDLGILIGKYGL
ncbi:hypothetical protein HGA91_02730 [candidate division WWE3 bacterium]|nr:hypothetical protein [candidate division WWE3 bacterium]